MEPVLASFFSLPEKKYRNGCSCANGFLSGINDLNKCLRSLCYKRMNNYNNELQILFFRRKIQGDTATKSKG